MANPKAEIEITAQTRTLGAKLRETRATLKRFGGDVQKSVFGKGLVENGFASKAGAQLVGNLGSSAVSAIGSALAEQGRDVLDFNDALTRLQITASRTPEEVNAFGQAIRQASNQTGISARDILAGSQAYVALTGDFDGAAASARTWTRVAQATGSTVSDIAQTAAALKQQLNITPEQTETAFAALAAQGKAGAIELKDLAAQLSSIAPQWAEFTGGKSIQGVKELGAALQIVKRGFGGDASETVTGLQSLLNALIKNAARFQKAGIKVFDKDPKTGAKSLRSVFDIVDSIANSKLIKDPTKLEKALGRVEAYRAFLQLRNNRSELDKMVQVAGDASLIQRDLDTYLQSTGGRSAAAFAKAKNEIAEAFTPERIEAFTTALIAASKAAATLATVASKVLGGAEDFGAGLAQLVGGQSESDRINELRAKRYQERRNILARQFDEINPRSDRTDPGYIARRNEAITTQIGLEESLLNNLSTQISGGRITRKVLNRQQGPLLPGEERAQFVDRGNYSIAELQALKGVTRTASDAAIIEKTIDLAIQKAMLAQAAGLEKISKSLERTIFASGTKPIEVKADGKAIVDVHRGSAAHARRPGS